MLSEVIHFHGKATIWLRKYSLSFCHLPMLLACPLLLMCCYQRVKVLIAWLTNNFWKVVHLHYKAKSIMLRGFWSVRESHWSNKGIKYKRDPKKKKIKKTSRTWVEKCPKSKDEPSIFKVIENQEIINPPINFVSICTRINLKGRL